MMMLFGTPRCYWFIGRIEVDFFIVRIVSQLRSHEAHQSNSYRTCSLNEVDVAYYRLLAMARDRKLIKQIQNSILQTVDKSHSIIGVDEHDWSPSFLR